MHAHKHGLVSNTTWMANFPESGAAAETLRGIPSLDVGIHLNATAGKPMLPAASVTSLVDSTGNFYTLGPLVARVIAGRIRIEELRREWAQQIEAGLAAGLSFSSLTSHQHVHMFPSWFALSIELARRYDIPILRSSRFRPLGRTLISPKFLALELCGSLIPRNTTVRMTSWVMSLEAFLSERDFRGGWTSPLIEVVAHPGYVDDQLRERDPLVEPRLDELSALTDPSLRDAVARAGVGITTFRNLT